MAAMCGLSLGFCATTTASIFTTLHPASRLIGGLQKNGAVGALVIRIGVGEKRADIAQARSTQNGIGDGVQQRVGVAVAVKAQRMFDFDAAENEFAAFHQAM